MARGEGTRRDGGFSRRWEPWRWRRSWGRRARRRPPAVAAGGPAVIAAGGVFLVNGWVLTAAIWTRSASMPLTPPDPRGGRSA